MEPWIIVLGIIVYGIIVIIAKGIFDEMWKDWPKNDRNMFAIFWFIPAIVSIVVLIMVICMLNLKNIIALTEKFLYNPGKILGKNIKKIKDGIMRL